MKQKRKIDWFIVTTVAIVTLAVAWLFTVIYVTAHFVSKWW